MSYLKKILLFTFCMLPMMLSAQTQNSSYKNEIGIDVTSLTVNLLGSGASGGAYDFTYKRHFDKFTLRFGLDLPSSFSEDEELGFAVSAQKFRVSSRIGIEKASSLASKWNVFYGIDFRQTVYSFKDEAIRNNGEFLLESTVRSSSVGLAPLLGLEFIVNDRISIRTEASMLGYIFQSEYKYEVNQLVDDPQTSVPNFSDLDRRGTSFRYNSPSFLVLTYKF